MKTLHLEIIITATMVSLVAFGTYVIVHQLFGGIAPSPTFKGYIRIDTPGLEKTYEIGQPINFSVLIQGFGLYPCQSPQIVIYNNAQTKPVFYYTTQSISCPDSSEHYVFYFPSQNSTFSTMINETGNYTLDVSIGKDSSKEQFSVILPSRENSHGVKIAVDDLNDTYLVGQRINFNLTTTSKECSRPHVTLTSANGSIVWTNRPDFMFCDVISAS